jgi:DNA polymerase III subunit delta'
MAKKTAAKKTSKSAARKRVKTIPRPDSPKSSLEVRAPIPLSSVLGHDRALGQLNAAVASGRLHHAWIFHGPEGVGKFTAALAWGAMLLDPSSSPGLTGVYECDPASPTQRLLASGTHPDLHVVRKELARFSQDARVRDSKLATIPKGVVEDHLIAPASVAPVMRTSSIVGKVFIVDEAELLDRSPSNAPTQNAILKTLEEPAPRTAIILVTSSEDRLLPTIRSRCQRVVFGTLDDRAMQTWLERSGLEVAGDERAWLLRAAQGSPGCLQALQEAGAYQWHLALDPMLVEAARGVHPLALGATMTKLVDDWASGWVKAGEKAGENRSKDAANRAGVRRMLSLVAEHARSGLADPVRSSVSLRTIDLVARAQQQIDTNVQMRMVFDHLAAGLSAGR